MIELIIMLAVLALTFVIGYLLISRVPQRLHTPLMSMTNGISAVTILGALILFSFDITPFEGALGTVALAMAAFNLVGAFAVTARMLRMFKSDRRRRPSE